MVARGLMLPSRRPLSSRKFHEIFMRFLKIDDGAADCITRPIQDNLHRRIFQLLSAHIKGVSKYNYNVDLIIY